MDCVIQFWFGRIPLTELGQIGLTVSCTVGPEFDENYWVRPELTRWPKNRPRFKKKVPSGTSDKKKKPKKIVIGDVKVTKVKEDRDDSSPSTNSDYAKSPLRYATFLPIQLLDWAFSYCWTSVVVALIVSVMGYELVVNTVRQLQVGYCTVLASVVILLITHLYINNVSRAFPFISIEYTFSSFFSHLFFSHFLFSLALPLIFLPLLTIFQI